MIRLHRPSVYLLSVVWVFSVSVCYADGPKRAEPVVASAMCTMAAGNPSCGVLQEIYAVPAGKRLVIEYFSCLATMYSGQALMCEIVPETSGGSIGFLLPLTPSAPSTGFGVSAGQQIRLYSDSETKVTVNGLRSGNTVGSVLVQFQISGYLEDSR